VPLKPKKKRKEESGADHPAPAHSKGERAPSMLPAGLPAFALTLKKKGGKSCRRGKLRSPPGKKKKKKKKKEERSLVLVLGLRGRKKGENSLSVSLQGKKKKKGRKRAAYPEPCTKKFGEKEKNPFSRTLRLPLKRRSVDASKEKTCHLRSGGKGGEKREKKKKLPWPLKKKEQLFHGSSKKKKKKGEKKKKG